MRRHTLYRHPNCARCARISRFHQRFDWLGRLECSTATPPDGVPLRMGEILLRDNATGAQCRGVDVVRAIFRNIPAYWPLLPLLYLPPLARRIDRETRGDCGDACAT